MKRLTGVLLVLAIFGAGYLTGACIRGDAPDSGRGMDALSAQEGAPTGGDQAKPVWHDDFDRSVAEQREMDQTTGVYKDNAYAVPLDWLLAVVLRSLDKEEKNLKMVVTDPKGIVMSPEKYRIFILGYKEDRDLSWAEDFPPILYP